MYLCASDLRSIKDFEWVNLDNQINIKKLANVTLSLVLKKGDSRKRGKSTLPTTHFDEHSI